MAIDNEQINDEYYGGTDNPYPMMVQPSLAGFYTPLGELLEECKGAFTYDPERAKEFLKVNVICPIKAWNVT